jgi:lysophospholipase L1-like esterase
MMQTKRILCYGDSNTWGYIPKTGQRYGQNIRWPSVMADLLGKGFEIMEEGLNGRTTSFDDPLEDSRNGVAYIKPCLLTNKPLDLVIVMLGSNDLKRTFNLTPFIITKGLGQLVERIRSCICGNNDKPPEILIVSPIQIGESILQSDIAGFFDETAVEKSKCLKRSFQEYAIMNGLHFLDAAQFAKPSQADGLHMDPEDHLKLAQAMKEKVLELI